MAVPYSSIFERMCNADPDIRYMAINDLSNELKKDSYVLEKIQEDKLKNKMMGFLFDDSNDDIANQAQSCIGIFVARIDDSIGKQMAKFLTEKLTRASPNLALRASYALKSVIETAKKATIFDDIPETLINVIAQNKISNNDIQLEIIERIADLLRNFGEFMKPHHAKILQLELKSVISRENSKKSLYKCLAYASSFMNDENFAILINHVQRNIRTQETFYQLVNSLNALKDIIREVGSRLNPFLNDLVPLVLSVFDSNCGALTKSQAEFFNNDTAAKETTFQIIEYLVTYCNSNLGNFLPRIIERAKQSIHFDGSSSPEDGDGGNGSVSRDDEFDDSDFQFEQEGFELPDDDPEEDGADGANTSMEDDDDEDEDQSWRIRKSAIKLLASIFNSIPHLPENEGLLKELINRIPSERDPSVMIEIISTLQSFIKQSKQLKDSKDTRFQFFLSKYKQNIVENLSKSLKDNKIRKPSWIQAWINIFSLLKELIGCLGSSEGFEVLIDTTSAALKEKNFSLNSEALVFLRHLLQRQGTDQPIIALPADLGKNLLTCLMEANSKLAVDALSTCTVLLKYTRPNPENQQVPENIAEFVNSLADRAIIPRLPAKDIDRDVKQATIACSAVLIALYADLMVAAKVNNILELLCDRLKHEISWLSTINALCTIIESPLAIQYDQILESYLKALTEFLKRNDRQLQQAALNGLIVLAKRKQGYSEISTNLQTIFDRISALSLISDRDLQITQQSLQFVLLMLQLDGDFVVGMVTKHIVPSVLTLLQSNIVAQGTTLQLVLQLFAELIKTNEGAKHFEGLKRSLLEITNNCNFKQLNVIGKALATLISNSSPADQNASVQQFVEIIKQNQPSKELYISLFTVGELGNRKDLSFLVDIESQIFQSLSSNDDDVRTAASFALGNLAIGNIGKYLPFIIESVNNHPAKQSYLLLSLREIVAFQSASPSSLASSSILVQLDNIMQLLLSQSNNEKETVRNVVAECLGRLIPLKPVEIIAQLKTKLSSNDSNTLATVVTALKFTTLEAGLELETSDVLEFLSLLRNESLLVRRASLSTFNNFVYFKPSYASALVDLYLDAIYSETAIKPEHLRQVLVGPFSQTIDDGVQNRVAAYECLHTILVNCSQLLELSNLLNHIILGLRKDKDVRSICLIMVEFLAPLAHSEILNSIDELILAFEELLHNDKHQDLTNNIVRSIAAISGIRGISNNKRFNDFVRGLPVDILDKIQNKDGSNDQASSPSSSSSSSPFQ